ncbi:MAG: amidohydrolase family protein, partial [Brachybacterium tyrofermentans]
IERAAATRTPVVTTLVNIDEFETYASQGEAKFPAYAAHMRRLRAGRYERTRDAHDAGIPLLVGTDAGGVLGHGIIHDELDELSRAGLTATQILEAAAWAPRRFLDVPGLEDGAPADLLVVPEDPRAGHGTLRRTRHVVLRGDVVHSH